MCGCPRSGRRTYSAESLSLLIFNSHSSTHSNSHRAAASRSERRRTPVTSFQLRSNPRLHDDCMRAVKYYNIIRSSMWVCVWIIIHAKDTSWFARFNAWDADDDVIKLSVYAFISSHAFAVGRRPETMATFLHCKFRESRLHRNETEKIVADMQLSRFWFCLSGWFEDWNWKLIKATIKFVFCCLTLFVNCIFFQLQFFKIFYTW